MGVRARIPDDFERFYRESKDGCLRALLATVPGVTGAEDLIAEAFTRALTRWDTVSTHPAPAAWIVRTALNLHRDEWRSRTRQRRIFRAVDENHVSSSELDPALVALLDALSVRQREVLAFRVLLGLSNEQTAHGLGIDAGTVPTHLRRALASLRRTHPTREGIYEQS